MTEASIQVCVQLSHMLVQAGPDLAAYKVRDGWAKGRRGVSLQVTQAN